VVAALADLSGSAAELEGVDGEAQSAVVVVEVGSFAGLVIEG